MHQLFFGTNNPIYYASKEKCDSNEFSLFQVRKKRHWLLSIKNKKKLSICSITARNNQNSSTLSGEKHMNPKKSCGKATTPSQHVQAKLFLNLI